jgi:hypothetical protein
VVGLMTAAITDAPPPVRRPRGLLDQLKELFRL